MTEKQRDYILGLDETLIDFHEYNEPRFTSKDILGEGWVERYKDIPHPEASNCINKLNEEVKRCGCYDCWGDLPFGVDYEGDAII